CFDAPAPSSTYALSLHDALPICGTAVARVVAATLRIPFIERSHQEGHLCAALASSGFNPQSERFLAVHLSGGTTELLEVDWGLRSEEHTSELQSRENLVCRLLLE